MSTPTKTTDPAAPLAPSAPAPIALRYVGPPGQTSPVFGALVPDTEYLADASFAAYLADTHPDYWQRA